METQLTTNPNEADELLEAQAEIRHLRETTLILREELETKRFEKDAAVQQAIQRSADEIQQLKSTATSLRDELESLRFRKRRRRPAGDPTISRRNPATQEHRHQPP